MKMFRFNDAQFFLDQKAHGFSEDVAKEITEKAFRTLINRARIGMYLVPILYVLASYFTEYRSGYPRLFWFLLVVFCFCIVARLISSSESRVNRAGYQTIFFVSCSISAFAFGTYVASAIYFYGDTWTNTLSLFMLAAISGASISSFCIWQNLSRSYMLCLLAPVALVSFFFCTPEARIVGVFCLIAYFYNVKQLRLWNSSYWQAHINVYLLEDEVEKQKQLEHELLRERDIARTANRSKSEFLANMSHELRTPMHGILSYAEFGTLRSHKASRDKLHEYFYEIADSGDRLMLLLNDLLDLAKLESGKMRYIMEKQDMRECILSITGEFKAVLEKKGLELKLDFAGTPLIADFDADRIGQVLRNLLSNSIKFSDTGTMISITAEQKMVFVGKSLHAVIMVSVSDQGIGIPEQELDTVFDKFIQSSKTKTGAGGTGLGLAICQEIIHAHKGTIRVQNNPDGGTLFSFCCPVLRE